MPRQSGVLKKSLRANFADVFLLLSFVQVDRLMLLKVTAKAELFSAVVALEGLHPAMH